MINKKIGISISWFTRSMSNDLFNQSSLRDLIKNIFLKQNIFISEIYLQEYPKTLHLLFNIFPINQKQYKLILIINLFLKAFLTVYTKKNVYINFKLVPNLYNNVDILIEWLNLKLYNQPLKTKKLLKQILKQYDTITK